MIVACLDLEGVLFPEIWINVADAVKIKELRLTTRDISDYDKLMRHRLKILSENRIKMDDIKNIIGKMKPLPGAEAFYNELVKKFQVIILSDTYYQFAMPLMAQLNYPTLFCHNLIVDKDGFIADYKIRIKESKRECVIKLKELNFKVIASGDSYNDVAMLKAADKGIFFMPPDAIIKEYPEFIVAVNYRDLLTEFNKAADMLISGQ